MLTTFKEWVSMIQSLIMCIAIIGGGLWGWHEYDEKKNQDRINQSFNIIDQLKASEEYRSYEGFADSNQVYNILHDKSLKGKGSEKSKRITELHDNVVKNQLKRLIDMYEDMATCVEVSRCDKNTIAVFIASKAHATYVIGYGVIDEMRKRYGEPQYANELVQIREWYCTLPKSISNLKQTSWCEKKIEIQR